MRLDELNALDPEAAERELLRCCGSRRWARLMAAARPFTSAEALRAKSNALWASLDRADWMEAFAAHPPIGETERAGTAGAAGRAGEARTAGTAEWSAAEQAGVAGASDAVRRRLAETNRAYEVRFGYIFIVCAAGKTATEMLDMLERRMKNSPDAELLIAAEEQRKITELRLAKLIA